MFFYYESLVLYVNICAYDFSHGTKLTFCYRFTWTKDDKPFDLSDPRVVVANNSGTFRIPNEGHVSHFQGRYRCFASNRLGAAMSEEIEFIVPSEYHGGRRPRAG